MCVQYAYADNLIVFIYNVHCDACILYLGICVMESGAWLREVANASRTSRERGREWRRGRGKERGNKRREGGKKGRKEGRKEGGIKGEMKEGRER